MIPAASHAWASATAVPFVDCGPVRAAAAARPGCSPRRVRPRFEECQPLLEPAGGRPALPCAADQLGGRRRVALGQAAPRRDHAGHRVDQLVRADPQGGIGLLQLAMRLPQFVPFQVHGRERDAHGRGDVLGEPVAAALGGRAASPASSTARLSRPAGPPPARDARGSRPARTPCPGSAAAARPPRTWRPPRRGDRPAAPGPAGRQHLRANPGMAGQQARRQLPEQGLRTSGRSRRGIEIPGAAGHGQPDQRRGQPGRDVVVGGKTPQQALPRWRARRRPPGPPRRTARSPRSRAAAAVAPRSGPGECGGTRRRAADGPVAR